MEDTPSSPKQPEPKKLKMSTTTSDDDESIYNTVAAVDGAGQPTERKIKYKRRKIAIFFAYCGVGYQGMQKNPGAKTIEGDLEEALFQAGAVPEPDRGKPKRFDFARSARTDKGVSAVGQVVSGRFYIDPPGLIDRLNSLLPDQIRMFGFKRVTASFNAKKFCDRRRYVYLIPVFALDPSSHPDRESVLASLGSEIELSKCLECSDRGRKVEGIMGKRSFEPKDSSGTVVHSDILSNNGDAKPHSEANGVPEVSVIENDNANLTLDDSNNGHVENEAAVDGNELQGQLGKCGNGEEKPKQVTGFSYGEKEKERLNGILKQYVGTHNFHNFTTRIKPEDPAAKRYILSFDANTVVTVDGIDFVKCEVLGQSFMLHQIRKMVGLAVAIMRNCAPESLLAKALQKEVSITVPTAPEVGLYLEECLFSSYNQKWEDTHEEVSMKAYAEAAEDFKMKKIYPHIASTEHREGSIAVWLHSLNHRNYPDLRAVSDEETTESRSAEPDVGAVNNEVTTEAGSAEPDASAVNNEMTTEAGSAEPDVTPR